MEHYTKLAEHHLGGFQLQELLAEEAQMVATYSAKQSSLNRTVAVQILNPEFDQTSRYRVGFKRSAEIMSNLEHAHIAPIHDFGSIGELLYIVTRLMDGGSLRKRLADETIAPQDAVLLARQIASALDYAHSRSIIHGDPSVANIAFDNWGNAYLVDFHVAGFQDQGPMWIGTPAYMAPEKVNTGIASAATDQYALGCICYSILIGKTSLPRVFYESRLDPDLPIISPREFNEDVPTMVNAVFERALANDPQDRYPTVTDFARDFEKAMQQGPQHLFISYSRRDLAYVQALKLHLQHNGFELWIDDTIEHGDKWFNEINDAINTCAAFVVVMSPDAEQSEWVQKEILLAKRYKKPIFPLLYKGQEFPILIDLQYANVAAGQMPDTDFHQRIRRVVFGQ